MWCHLLNIKGQTYHSRRCKACLHMSGSSPGVLFSLTQFRYPFSTYLYRIPVHGWVSYRHTTLFTTNKQIIKIQFQKDKYQEIYKMIHTETTSEMKEISSRPTFFKCLETYSSYSFGVINFPQQVLYTLIPESGRYMFP